MGHRLTHQTPTGDAVSDDAIQMTPEEAAFRADSMISTIGGLGDPAYDKTAGNNRSIKALGRYTEDQLEAIYEGSALAGRFVDVPANECTRCGWRAHTSKADGDAPAEPFRAEFQRLDLTGALRARDRWASLYGGAAILLGVNDGLDLDAPMKLEAVDSLDYLRVADMHELRVRHRYGESSAPTHVVPPGKMGEPMLYELTPHNSVGQTATMIHESRVIRQVGAPVPPRKQQEVYYWGASVLQRAIPKLLNIEAADVAMANIMEEFRIAVLRLKGLAGLVQAKDGTERLMKRMLAMNLGKSVVRSVLLDAESEEYTQQGAPVTGLPELYEKVQQQVAACADGMPLDLLFGTSPKGLSSSNESGRKHWQDTVARRQTFIYEPAILRVCEVLRATGAVDVPMDADIDVVFNPLETPSEKERSESRNLDSQADERWWRMGALGEHEIALSRFGGVGYSSDVRLMSPEEIEASGRGAEVLPSDTPPEPVE